MATHSNILVWKIPWTEEPGGLQSMHALIYIIVSGVEHDSICRCCEMITTVTLVNIYLHSFSVFFLVTRTFKIYCLSNFPMCTTVLITVVASAVHYAPITYFIIGNLYLSIPFIQLT